MADNTSLINDQCVSCIGVISNYILMYDNNEQFVFEITCIYMFLNNHSIINT